MVILISEQSKIWDKEGWLALPVIRRVGALSAGLHLLAKESWHYPLLGLVVWELRVLRI